MRASGQQVDIRGQGVPLMKKMGIEAAVRAASVHEPGTQLIDRNGKIKAFFSVAESGSGKQGFTSEFEIMRGDLVPILYALTENDPNVRHLFDTTIKSFTQDDESNPNGKVHVSFQDGHEEDFDLVIAADGTGSRTRKMMLGEDAPDPRREMEGYIGYYSVPSNPGDSDRATFCHLPGARIIGTRKDIPELTRVNMRFHGKKPALDEALRSGDQTRVKQAIADIYQGGGWECDRFMDVLLRSPDSDDLYITPIQEVHLPPGLWSKGRVVILGDAAQCHTAGGYGCAWALVGAYVLAGEIATLLKEDASSPTAAIVQGAKNYEEKFRPISTAMHGGYEWFDNLLAPHSNLGIWCLHTFARVASYLRFDQMSGLNEVTSKWQLPEYPALD
ncbi:FAD/NAD(P)-binding domain-containing protein [Trichoderma barbatum]